MRRLYQYRALRAEGLTRKQILLSTGWHPRVLDLLRQYDSICSPPLSLTSTYVADDGSEVSLEDSLIDADAEQAFKTVLDIMTDTEIELYVHSLPEPIRTVLIERCLNDQKTPLRDLAERLELSQTQIRKVQSKGLRMIEREFRKRGVIERLAYSSTGFGRMSRNFTSNTELAALENMGEL